MMAGGFAVQKLDARTEAIGQELLAGLGPDDRALVIVTRQYGINDPVLNMDIPNLLIDRGQKVIALSNLRAHDIDVSIDYPGVVWPFGQHILAGMKLIRRDPRLFAVYLTNHGGRTLFQGGRHHAHRSLPERDRALEGGRGADAGLGACGR